MEPIRYWSRLVIAELNCLTVSYSGAGFIVDHCLWLCLDCPCSGQERFFFFFWETNVSSHFSNLSILYSHTEVRHCQAGIYILIFLTKKGIICIICYVWQRQKVHTSSSFHVLSGAPHIIPVVSDPTCCLRGSFNILNKKNRWAFKYALISFTY